MLFGRLLLAKESFPVLLLQLDVISHHPRRVVSKAFRNAVPHFADLVNHLDRSASLASLPPSRSKGVTRAGMKSQVWYSLSYQATAQDRLCAAFTLP